jgi:hypothetical protein
MKKKLPKTEFLNVDVDLEALSGLDDLLKALKRRIIVLHREGSVASFEMATGQGKSLDATIRRILGIIEALPPRARKLWAGCRKRSLNIGFRAGLSPHYSEFAVSAETIQRAASIKAEIVITIYGRG